MKTNNLTKKSLLTSMIMIATALFHKGATPSESVHHGNKEGGSFWNPQGIFIPRRRKFKGWMREKRRSTFNKNR
jgi:hypothetical protein